MNVAAIVNVAPKKIVIVMVNAIVIVNAMTIVSAVKHATAINKNNKKRPRGCFLILFRDRDSNPNSQDQNLESYH